MGRESGMWAGLRERLVAGGVGVRRLTERFDPGVPDVLWVDRVTGVTGLLELKAVADYPKTDRGTFMTGLEREQVVWLRTWASENGLGAVLCRVTKPRHWLVWRASADPAWARLMLESPLDAPYWKLQDPLDVGTLMHYLTIPNNRL